MNIHDKIYLRSIELLAISMIKEENAEERQRIADEISKLIEDVISTWCKRGM